MGRTTINSAIRAGLPIASTRQCQANDLLSRGPLNGQILHDTRLDSKAVFLELAKYTEDVTTDAFAAVSEDCGYVYKSGSTTSLGIIG